MRTPFRYAVTAVALAACTGAALLARQSAPRSAPVAPAASTKSTAPGQGPMPPLNMTGYALARPAGITRTVYEFVARHPEVSRYVPCFCGCEHDGHRSNESCFVAARDTSGNVTQWDTHGFGCAVCVDVARETMQLYNSGADVQSIRSAIEKKWAPQYPSKTPTPMPPAKKK